jgi:type I restriction enzyme R subunit
VVVGGTYEHLGADILASMRVEQITAEGMKIDRMFFERFEDVIRANDTVAAAVEAGQWDRVIDYVNREVFDKPEEYYTLDKLRKAAAVDRRLTLREILEKVFGLIPRFKSKDELLEEEFSKFVADRVPEPPSAIPAIKTYFKAYVTSNRVRDIIDSGSSPIWRPTRIFTTHDFRAVPQPYRTLVPEYVKDYVSLNQFAMTMHRNNCGDEQTNEIDHRSSGNVHHRSFREERRLYFPDRHAESKRWRFPHR